MDGMPAMIMTFRIVTIQFYEMTKFYGWIFQFGIEEESNKYALT